MVAALHIHRMDKRAVLEVLARVIAFWERI